MKISGGRWGTGGGVLGSGSRGGGGGGLGRGPLYMSGRGWFLGRGGGSLGGMAGGLSDMVSLASDMASFLRGGRGGGFSGSSPSWWRLLQDTD